jgi:small neutral amino acid transporter SnatA (MarC family)
MVVRKLGINQLKVLGGMMLLLLCLLVLLKSPKTSCNQKSVTWLAILLGSPTIAGPGAFTASLVLVKTNGLVQTSTFVVISLMVVVVILYLAEKWRPIVQTKGARIIFKMAMVLMIILGSTMVLSGLGY